MEISELLVTKAQDCNETDLELGITLLKERIRADIEAIDTFTRHGDFVKAETYSLLLKTDSWMISNLLQKRLDK